MREQGIPDKIWRVLFPILLYDLLAMILTKLLGMISGGRLLEQSAAMWLTALKNMLMLPVFCRMLQKDEKGRWGKIPNIKNIFLVILGAVCISRGINYFLSLTFLPYYFRGYQVVSEEIISCSFLSQIAATVVAAPLLEEMLMRGVIYGRLRETVREPRAAMFISALIFGLFHGNVVQGIYAFVMGLFFVQVYEACNSLFLAILAHIVVNSTSVLAGKLRWTENLYRDIGVYYLLTAGYLLIGMFCWKYFCRRNEEKV